MKDIKIYPGSSLMSAMKKLNKTAEKCLLVTNKENTLLGTLTDGDIRRAILKGANINEKFDDYYCKDPDVLIDGQFTKEEAGQIMSSRKHDLLPIVNSGGELVNYIIWEELVFNAKVKQKEKLSNPVVIMAGGKGTRLEPFTKVLPKPLIPIHDKTVLEHIIEKFFNNGCREFFITVNYKSKIIKAYFEELETDYSVNFVEEHEPLGTASSLQYLKGTITEPLLVTNCDVVVDIDYRDLIRIHNKYNHDITIVVSMKKYIIPYGTCVLDAKGHLQSLNEKPEYDFLINIGLYVINAELLKTIPEKQVYHITDLIADARENGGEIGVYPIDDDNWIDVGQWAEYQKAIEKL